MTDQSNEAAIFSDLGSSPASFEASRWADFYGSLKEIAAKLFMRHRPIFRHCSSVANVGWNCLLKLFQMSTRNCIILFAGPLYCAPMPFTDILM